jgi:hypothetical protein
MTYTLHRKIFQINSLYLSDIYNLCTMYKILFGLKQYTTITLTNNMKEKKTLFTYYTTDSSTAASHRNYVKLNHLLYQSYIITRPRHNTKT